MDDQQELHLENSEVLGIRIADVLQEECIDYERLEKIVQGQYDIEPPETIRTKILLSGHFCYGNFQAGKPFEKAVLNGYKTRIAKVKSFAHIIMELQDLFSR